MTGENTAVKAYFEEKRIYFDQGNTLPYAFRKEMLKKLKAGIQEHEAEIVKALNQKSPNMKEGGSYRGRWPGFSGQGSVVGK